MDEGAIAYLTETYGDQLRSGQLSLSSGDGRTTLLPDPDTGRWSVVSNLPYNVGTIIFLNLLEQRGKIDRMVLMFQAEVARRILSGPGSKNHGFLSVLTALEWKGSRAIKVRPGSFFPPPKIKSEVILLERDDSLPGWPSPRPLFRTFVDGCFKARRKMLKNSLVQAGYDADRVRVAMEESGIASNMRGEQLEAPLIAQLYETMKTAGAHVPQKSRGR
jgi:16S rRNA (adenine1518-N6/adenine1519-N6)-dimethyltransferase